MKVREKTKEKNRKLRSYTNTKRMNLPTKFKPNFLTDMDKRTDRQLAKVNKSIANLVNAIAGGADVSLLLDKQNELKAEKQILETRLDELNQTLVNMPDPEQIENDAMILRLYLAQQHQDKDWRKLSFDDVRRFLHFLFSDNPRQNGFGIFINKENGRWNITFKGCVQFYHDVIDGRAVSHLLKKEADRINAKLQRDFENDVAKADKAYQEVKRAGSDIVKPKLPNTFKYIQNSAECKENPAPC